MNPQPPKLAQKLFDWFCGNAHVDDLRGDMEELFFINLKNKSRSYANKQYWKHMLQLIFSYAVKKRKRNAQHHHYSSSQISIAMVQNYIKVAFRSLYQHRYFTILNIAGLAIGMSISLLLISMYGYVRSADNFHTNPDRIYTVVTKRTEGIEERELASSPILLQEKLKTEVASIAQAVPIVNTFYGEIANSKDQLNMKGYYTNDTFLKTFNFPLIDGSAEALQKPYSIILTEKCANKIFGNTHVVGKTVEVKELGIFSITGVLKDYPKNTHFSFEALVSLSTLGNSYMADQQHWYEYNAQYNYFLAAENFKEEDIQSFFKKIEKELYANKNVKVEYELMPLREIITSEEGNAIGPKWELSGFIVFGIIALLILLPACFNYTNISLARALKRAKEIGIRKTMGGQKNQIFLQFITETVVVCLFALTGAWLILLFIRGEFQSMLVHASTLDLSVSGFTVFLFICLALLTGFVAGFFPALYFSRLNPVEAIKSKVSNRFWSGMRVRKYLTVFQFSLSFCFILSLVVFGRQYHEILHFDFGFQKENIVVVDLQNTKPELNKTLFSQVSGVESVSLSSGSPISASSHVWLENDVKDSIAATQLFIDNTFLQTFKIDLVVGNNFDSQGSNNRNKILVNETFLAKNKIRLQNIFSESYKIDGEDYQVIGVVKDFHFLPPPHPIQNFVFRYDETKFAYVNLLVNNSDNVFNLFTNLENAWKQTSQETKLKAKFFQDDLNESYLVYRYLLKMAGALGVFALSISVLGLLGMVVYTTQNRIKEISIRKTLGASIFNITLLLSKEYLRLLLFAIVVGIPLALFIYDSIFTRIPDYQSDLRISDLFLGALGLLIIGLCTITSQTYKTALLNPAETLKSE